MRLFVMPCEIAPSFIRSGDCRIGRKLYASQNEVLSFIPNNLKNKNGTSYAKFICPAPDPKKVYVKTLELPNKILYDEEFAAKIEAKGLTEVNELIETCKNYKQETKDQEPFSELIYKT